MDMMKNRAWKVGIVAGSLLALFLLVISIKEIKSIGYIGKDVPAYNSITVTGKGESVAIPDIATVSWGVTESGKTVEEAQTKATEKSNKALEVVRMNGIEDKDIKTLSYSINPKYEYDSGVCNEFRCTPGKSTLVGYEVSQTVEVKIRDLKIAGKLFESIGSVGVDNVNGLNFSVDDIETVKADARSKAIADAKAKADKLSDELGVKIVRIISFYDMSDEPYPYAYGGDMMEGKGVMTGASVAPEIPQGEQTYQARVSITYEIR